MSDLNEKQLEAVETVEGPVLILAGAGSGKTTVLINRIAHMIKHCGIAPWSILTITFTNKAANEIKSRLELVLGEEALDIWASTFHSMCVRIMRRDCERMGYKSGFAIFDSADQLTLMKECLKELNFSDKDFPPRSIIGIISGAKDKMVLPDQFENVYGNDYRMSKVAQIYKRYQAKLKKCNAMDFDDLIMQTVLLLEQNEDVLKYYQHKFKYIMVDEYQDTSHCQYRLISNLARVHKNICVVGDDDQSIYKFRGADISNILNFEHEFKNAKVIKLEQNYRSTQCILDAANAVIKNNVGRKDKALWTSQGAGDKIEVYSASNEHDEAYFIANKIIFLKEQGYEYKDIAILFRMNAQSRVLEEVMLNKAVPYRLLSGLKFYDRKEIKDLIAYLRLISNHADDISLLRVINEPKRGIGKTTMDKVAQIAATTNQSMYQVLQDIIQYPELRRASDKVIGFTKLIGTLTDLKGEMTVSELTSCIIDKTGYQKMLEAENTVEARTRIENIKEFMTVVLEFEKNVENGSLEEFLEGIALVSDIDNYDEDQDAVVMMTLHSAKGLEFPVVFLVGMEEGVFPSMRSVTEPGEIEEERRLCYVGVTRAKERLFLTGASSRTIFGSTTYNRPSRFLSEIPEKLLVGEVKKKVEPVEQRPKQELYTTIFARKPQAPREPLPDFKVGDTVEHPKFGRGIILSAQAMGNDMKLSIAFDSVGTKNLMAVFAKLKKL